MTFGGRPRYGYQDVGAGVKRFDYMDRMDEAEDDGAVAALQRAEAARKSIPPVVPDQTLNVNDTQVAVYLNAKAHAVREREMKIAEQRRGDAR